MRINPAPAISHASAKGAPPGDLFHLLASANSLIPANLATAPLSGIICGNHPLQHEHSKELPRRISGGGVPDILNIVSAGRSLKTRNHRKSLILDIVFFNCN